MPNEFVIHRPPREPGGSSVLFRPPVLVGSFQQCTPEYEQRCSVVDGPDQPHQLAECALTNPGAQQLTDYRNAKLWTLCTELLPPFYSTLSIIVVISSLSRDLLN